MLVFCWLCESAASVSVWLSQIEGAAKAGKFHASKAS